MKDNIQPGERYFREKAEKILKSRKSVETAKLSENETLKLIHELQVHQIQLELQNEELVRAKELATEASEKYLELYDFAPLGYFTLSPKGEIIQLNLAGAAMLGKDRSQLINRLFQLFLSNDTKPVFLQFLDKVFGSHTKHNCELTLSVANKPPVFVHVNGIASEDGGNCLITAIDITQHKLLEFELIEQKTLLDVTEHLGKIGGWTFNVKSSTQNWTQETFDILEVEITKGEPKVQEGIEMIDESHKQKAKIALQRAIDFGEPFEQEWKITTAKGNKRWVNTIGKANIANRKVISLHGSFQDITDRKLIELALKESNEFNLALMKTIPFGMDIVDENGNILFLNKNLVQFFGENAVDKKCWELYNIGKKQCDDCPLLSGIKMGETKIRKFHGKIDGKTFEISHTGMMYKGKKAMLEIFIDTTERDRAELLLKESEAKYHAIFNNIQDVFYQTDLKGTVLDISPSITPFAGFNPTEIIGKPVASLYFDIKDRKILLNAILKNTELRDFELRLKTKNGELKYVSINARLIFDAGGNPSHIDGAIRDITDRKRSQQLLNKNNKKYQELVNSISDVFFSMDNDLKYTYWNKASEKLTGLWSEDVIGKSINEIFPDNDGFQKVIKMFMEVIKYKKSQHLIINFPGNEEYIHDITAYPTDDGISVFIKDITEYKRAEEALFESNRVLHESQAVAHIGAYSLHLTAPRFGDNIWEVSPEIYKILGIYESYPHTLRGWEAIIHPDWRQEVSDYSYRTVEERKRYDSEYKIIRLNDGEERWVHSIGEIKFDDQQNPIRMLGTLQDITDRKVAEEALQKSIAMQRKIVSNIGDVIVIIDDKGNNKYNSPNIETLFGWNPEELLGNKAVDIVHPDDHESIKKLADSIELEPNATLTTEIRYRCKNGKYVWIEITLANLHSDPDVNGLLGNYHDVTERRQSEELLIKLKTAIEKSEVSVVITNNKGNIEYANPYFTKLTGYSENEYIGVNPRVLKTGYHSKSFYKEMWLTISLGNTWNGEFYNRKKSGEFYWEHAIISPIENDKKEITHYVAIKTDITEAKNINNELVVAKEQAEQSDQLKSAFLANMSHEIRTPMNGILGFAQLLKEPDLTGEQQEDYLQIIEKSGARMLNIINDIVDISKIESGLMTVNVSLANANEQLENIYAFFKPEAESKGLKLSFKTELPLEEATFETDTEKLYAILVNLIKNSLKYTDKGSIVFGYTIKTAEADDISNIEFFVKDTGIGIPKDRQEAIFERFIQVDVVDKMARQGAGLGLSISKAYIEMLGGNIWIESAKGKGSTFYFTLPFAPYTPNINNFINEVFDAGKKPAKLKLNILIAEDDELSGELISLIIGKYAKDLIKVQNGIEAVEVCRSNPGIDLILMDIQMPKLSGFEAARQIREFNKHVIIIAQTSYALIGDKEKALEAGCTDYISKPIKANKLESLIRKYFS